MLRKIGLCVLLFCVVGVVVFVAGPRVDVAYHRRATTLPDNLDNYLRAEEARVPGVIAGSEKTIVWARPDKAKTPLAIVYLHGFSATRQETAPLCDQVAAQLGANLFYTRLTGHALGGDALAKASVNDWLNDASEALAIGERLGEKVLVVGCSTGATLAAWLAAHAEQKNVLGYVLISANFAPADPNSRFLTWPWARQWVPLMVGENRKGSPTSERHGQYWTTSYPTIALLPMMGVCELGQTVEFERIEKPLLMVYSPRDRVVDVKWIEEVYRRWGAKKKEAATFATHGERETHVLAGDIRSPDGTKPVAETMVRFVQSIR